MTRWLVISNCLTQGLVNSLQALAPHAEVDGLYPHVFNRRPLRHNRQLSGYDLLFISPGLEAAMPQAALDRIPHHVALPWLSFRAYHPDLVYVEVDGIRVKGPADDYHSGIALAAYQMGLSIAETLRLFNGATYQACGMMELWSHEWIRMHDHFAGIGLDLRRSAVNWGRHQPFMYSNNHPKIGPVFDIAKALLARLEIQTLPGATCPHDNLAFASGFAVYPEIGEALGVEGAMVFKTYDTYRQIDLSSFVAGCFDVYDRLPRVRLTVIDEFAADFTRTRDAIAKLLNAG